MIQVVGNFSYGINKPSGMLKKVVVKSFNVTTVIIDKIMSYSINGGR